MFDGSWILKLFAIIFSSFKLGVMYFIAVQEDSLNGLVATLASVGS